MAGLHVIPRSEWTETRAPGVRLRQPVKRVFIHCTVVPDVRVSDDEMRRIREHDEAAIWRSLAVDLGAMRAVDRAHKANGWAGFGYNFAGFDDGTVWEGRGWSHVGAQVRDFNSISLGYAWFIDGDARKPTPEAWSAFARWLVLGIRAGCIDRDVWLQPHRAAPTADGKTCPGTMVSDGSLRDLERWAKAAARG